MAWTCRRCGETNSDYIQYCACSESRDRVSKPRAPTEESRRTTTEHHSAQMPREHHASLESWACPKCSEINSSYAHYCVSCFAARPPIRTRDEGGAHESRAKPHHKEVPPHHIVNCPGCARHLNLGRPSDDRIWRCPDCGARFKLSLDSLGVWRVRIEREDAKPPTDNPEREWYEILNVSKRASTAELRTAYRTLITQYHPDKTAALGPKLRHLAEEETKRINLAYEQAMKQRGTG